MNVYRKWPVYSSNNPKKRSTFYLHFWTLVRKDHFNFYHLTVLQIAELEGLDQKQISTYQTIITENNINGIVLSTCDLGELGQIMAMTFGDWQLFRAWILTARNPAQDCTMW